jgi:hypothetical protein
MIVQTMTAFLSRMLPLVTAAGDDRAAYEMGRSCGYVVGLCLLPALGIFGMILCAGRMRRPTANKKCHSSLLVFLGGWVVSMGATFGLQALDLGPASGCAGGFVLLGTVATSLALAIWGLVEFRSQRGRFVEGKGPAITTLVLCGLIGLLIAAGAATGVMASVAKARDRKAAAEAESEAKPLLFEDLRFSIKAPRPWVETDAKAINPEASVALIRRSPEMYFIVIAEALEEEDSITTKALLAAAKANVFGVSPSARVVEEAPETLNGVPGMRLVIEAKVQRMDILYRYWVHAESDIVYQLIAWGPPAARAAVLEEAGKVFKTFSILPEE